MSARSPEEIRRSIEANRTELGVAVNEAVGFWLRNVSDFVCVVVAPRSSVTLTPTLSAAWVEYVFVVVGVVPVSVS